jgi:hypothetical protein
LNGLGLADSDDAVALLFDLPAQFYYTTNRAAHDFVQQTLKKELQRLGIHVVDNDNDMRQQLSHLSSQKRGDFAILSTNDYLMYDQISKQSLSQAIAYIKLVSLVDSQGSWSQAISRQRTRLKMFKILAFFVSKCIRPVQQPTCEMNEQISLSL